MGRRRRLHAVRWLAPAAALAAAVLATSSTAFATAFTSGTLTRVPDRPLAGLSTTCANLVASQQALGSVNFPDGEVEPWISTDPTNSQHLVAAFQQDRWSDGGSNGLTTVVSFDGGAHWQLATTQPQFSICEGAQSGGAGFFNRATDPWVSFAPNGDVYQVSDSFNANGPGFGGASSIIVSKSTDGGLDWGAPKTIQLDTSTTVLNDKESVTADPTNASRVFVTWDRLVSPATNANPTAFVHSVAFRGPALLSVSNDGGQTWSPSQVIFDPGQNDQTIGNEIVVEPDGTVIDGFDLILNSGSIGNPSTTFSVAVIRSTDHGVTWSAPIVVTPFTDAAVSAAGRGFRTGDILPEFAVDPASGNLFATWQDGSFTSDGHAAIGFSESTDEGLHWSTPIRVNQTPNAAPAFTAQVHVAGDGTIGISYYDLRSATPYSPSGTSAFTTGYFLTHCSAGCTSPSGWTSENRVDSAPGFDMSTAPSAGGLFTGDYEALTSIGNSFGAFVVLARPEAVNGPSDPFFNTVGP